MKLKAATQADICRLMSWFPTQRSIDIWGGPSFRYPFTPATFAEDIRWRQMDSYCLLDAAGKLLAFGQIYERHGRINLVRLIVDPERRGQGVGKQLVALLMEKGREKLPLQEYSLYVYRDNHPAVACYLGMGFQEHEYPDDDEMAESCIYMTRPIQNQAKH